MSPFDPRRSAAAAVDQAVSRRTSDPRGCLLPERRLSPHHHHPARPQMACASLDEFLQMEGMERRKTTEQDVSRSDYTQCFIHYNLLYLQDLELERALGENGSDIPTGQPPARGAGYMSPPASPSRAAAAAAAGSPQRSIINQQVRRGAVWGGARRVLPVSESHR